MRIPLIPLNMKHRFLRLLRTDVVAWQHRRLLSTATARDIPIVAKKIGKKIPRAERKAMVEEYVNQYRSLNGGRFPGFDSTRKHVGGGYYTIRAILQELASNSELSAVATDAKCSTEAQTAQANRILAVKEHAGSETPAENFAVERGCRDSAGNGDKKLTASLDTSFQVNMDVTEEPGLVDKASSDITLKASLAEDSKCTGLGEEHKSPAQASDFTVRNAMNASKSNEQAGGSDLLAVDSVNKNAMVKEGAEAYQISQAAEIPDCNRTCVANSSRDAFESGLSSQGEVVSCYQDMKVDTSIMTKTIAESGEEISGIDVGFESTPSVEKTSIGPKVQAKMENSQVSACSGHPSKDSGKTMSTELGKNDELPRLTEMHDTRENEQQKASLWSNLKSVASGFINLWRRT